MSITLELPKELENELAAEAARLGIPLTDYALRILSSGRTVGNVPRTGTELVNYWRQEGLVGTRSDISDSQAHARKIRKEAEQRTRGTS